MERKCSGWKPEEIRNVGILVVRQRTESDPSENQREGDCCGQDTTPAQALVHPPPKARSVCDEGLSHHVAAGDLNEVHRTAQDSFAPKELPAPAPIHAGRRLVQPDVVVISNAPRGKDDS